LIVIAQKVEEGGRKRWEKVGEGVGVKADEMGFARSVLRRWSRERRWT